MPARTPTRSSHDKPGVELIQPYLDAARRPDRRRGPRGARRGVGGLRHLRLRPLRASRRTATSGTRTQGASPAATTRTRRPTTRCSSRASRTTPARSLATLFNYACHPTTLAWENRLLSPDYIGAAREVLEHAFGAPALFLQGASGELAPRDDYVGDTAVADRNGRQLGHAAAAAIEALPPAGHALRLHGHRRLGREPRHLGVPAVRRRRSSTARSRLAARADPRRARTQGGPRRRRERSPTRRPTRRAGAREGAASRVPPSSRSATGRPTAMPLWAWRLGEALLVAVPQRAVLRLPDRAAAALRGHARLRPDDDERRRRLPAAARDLRQRALPGAAVAVCAGLPGAVDRGRRRGPRSPSARMSYRRIVNRGWRRARRVWFRRRVEPPRIPLARGIRRASRRGSQHGHSARPAGLGRVDIG